MKIVATSRKLQGSGASRRLRNSGETPGILYGGSSAPIALTIDHNQIFHALKKESFHASIHDLELDGSSEKVLLRDYQKHAFKQLILHVDFQRVDPKQKVHMKVPLHFINAEESPAVKVSKAIINHVVNELEISCLPKDLPDAIVVDLAQFEAGKSLHLADIQLPAGVSATQAQENPTIVTATILGGSEDTEVKPAA